MLLLGRAAIIYLRLHANILFLKHPNPIEQFFTSMQFYIAFYYIKFI